LSVVQARYRQRTEVVVLWKSVEILDATQDTPPRVALYAAEQVLQARGFTRAGVLRQRNGQRGLHPKLQDCRFQLWANADRTVFAEASHLYDHDFLDLFSLFEDGTVARTEWCAREGGLLRGWLRHDPDETPPEGTWDRLQSATVTHDQMTASMHRPESGVHCRRPSGGTAERALDAHLALLDSLDDHGARVPLDGVADVGALYKRSLHALSQGMTASTSSLRVVMLGMTALVLLGTALTSSRLDAALAGSTTGELREAAFMRAAAPMIAAPLGYGVGVLLATVRGKALLLGLAILAWTAVVSVFMPLLMGGDVLPFAAATGPLLAWSAASLAAGWCTPRLASRLLPKPAGLELVGAEALLRAYGGLSATPTPAAPLTADARAPLVAAGFTYEGNRTVARATSADDPTPREASAEQWRLGDTVAELRDGFVSLRTPLADDRIAETRSLPDPGLLEDALGFDRHVASDSPPLLGADDLGRPWVTQARARLADRTHKGLTVAHAADVASAVEVHLVGLTGQATRHEDATELAEQVAERRARLRDLDDRLQVSGMVLGMLGLAAEFLGGIDLPIALVWLHWFGPILVFADPIFVPVRPWRVVVPLFWLWMAYTHPLYAAAFVVLHGALFVAWTAWELRK
jgi:hypothetical protein